ncbi:MAG: hypothetical protein K2M94_02580 [Paramuribaculum sp.]|nr:hypothetical protein [Paramuribaculum sp.]
MASPSVTGQIMVDKMMKYGQNIKPELIDNYRYSIYFTNNKKAYNLKGYEIASLGNKIQAIKVNPAGYSYAMLWGKKNKTKVTINALNSNISGREIKGLVSPSAICYSPDSRHLIVADKGNIKLIDSKTLVLHRNFAIGDDMPSELVVSDNGYYIAVVYENRVDVYNLNAGTLRQSFPVSVPTSVAFTASSECIGLLGVNGKLEIYSTADFKPIKKCEDIASTTSHLFFHPEENYAGFVADGNRVQFINLHDLSDQPSVYETGVSDARFVFDNHNNMYLASVTDTNIRYRELTGFSQNYILLINKKVEALMSEWIKMRPGETEVEYRQRVNEESISRQRELFVRQESSKLALTAGLGNFGMVTLGRYNPSDGTLIISLGNNLPDIYLKVPVEDMPGFGDGNNLQFSNQVYMVTQENTFKLIYVEVFNPTNGKTYIFDNLDGQNLDFLNTDDGFVSLDLILQSSRQDVILQDIKDRIMEEARAANRISDHTKLNVDTRIEVGVDATGRRIRNYVVDFAYEVDAEGSATEDFPPGKYRVEDSHAAESMLQIIRQAFISEFANYIVPGKELIIHITGSADAMPVNRAISYDGFLGEFDEEPCKVNGALTTISVNHNSGIQSNEELGFMRAQAVQKKMSELLPELATMNVGYRHNIEVAKEKGAQFRKISVSLEFIDAF